MPLPQRHRMGSPAIPPGSAGCKADWQAQWLMDSRFANVPPRELIHPNRCPENNGELQNVHTLFRKEFHPPAATIRQARLHVTADDCYKLYLNGEFVGLGPAPSYVFNYFYNSYDVTDALRSGQVNCVAAHVFYQGMHSLTFTSGDNRQGLLLQLEMDFDGGPAVVLGSDGSWRCHRLAAFTSRQIYGYQTAFSEHIDLRAWPHGWTEVGFDDSSWEEPHRPAEAIPRDYTLSAQPTPPVAVHRRPPVRVVKRGGGHFFIDFGTELTGETVFRVSGAAGHEVEVRHGEELEAPETVRWQMRCNCDYREFCTLSGKSDEELAFFDYKGFRYVEVLNWPEELTAERVWAHERHYPFPEDASHFTSDNELLNDIWTLCRDGVRVGTIDTFLDCPTREKGGFMGDGFVTGISHLILTGDARILRKFLQDVANTGHFCKGLHSTAPNYVNGELAEYSLLWPVLLEYYYLWTGDLAFVQNLLPVLQGLLEYYAGYENEDGLLQDVFSHATGRYSILVDWPKNLRDDYDDPYLMGARTEEGVPRGVVNTMLQGFYANALRAAARIATVTGCEDVSTAVEGKVDRLTRALKTQLWNPSTGLFLDRTGSEHSAFHANVSPFMAGLVPPEGRESVAEFIRQKRIACGVYFSCFLLKSLYDHGEADFAYELMTCRDEHSWHSMLQAGATTCMEAWAPDLKWNTSWCHPWSSAPVHMVAHEMLGLRPGAPGWQEIRFAPQPPADLASASIRLTTPQGEVTAGFQRDGTSIIYTLCVPDDCTARCALRPAGRGVHLNGTAVSTTTEESDGFGISRSILSNPLPAGRHTIQVGE